MKFDFLSSSSATRPISTTCDVIYLQNELLKASASLATKVIRSNSHTFHFHFKHINFPSNEGFPHAKHKLSEATI